MSAEASRTYSDKCRVLTAGLVEFVHQAGALGHVAADGFLGLPDSLVERRDLDAVLGPAEDHFLAILDRKLLPHLGRQNYAPHARYLATDEIPHTLFSIVVPYKMSNDIVEGLCQGIDD